MTHIFQGLKPNYYKTLIADPPWKEAGGGKIQRGANRHYELMSTKDICAMPVWTLVEPNAHLYLWVTNNFLRAGLEVLEAWGFRYVTMITWGKPVSGLGQYFRGRSEHVLFGVRGSLPYKNRSDGKRAQGVTFFEDAVVEDLGAGENFYFTEARPDNVHSRKPKRIHEFAELVSHGPYLELFCRTPRPGWDCWGNEVATRDADPLETIDP